MPQLIRTSQTKIVTKNGECELSISVEPIQIEITVNVNNSGNVIANAQSVERPKEEDDPKTLVAPEFGKNAFGSGKIKFGKNA